MFKDAIVSAAPASPEEALTAAAQLPGRLTRLDGVTLPPTATPSIGYQGTPRDGYCDALAADATGVVPLYQRLQFEHSVPGLVNALLFAAVLPQKWSWGHGCYDRDAELLLSSDRLTEITLGAGSKTPTSEELWPAAGLRIQRIEDGFVVACLASRPGCGLYDLSVAVTNGKTSPLEVREVFVWGQGVLY